MAVGRRVGSGGWDLMFRSVGACLLTLRPGARAPRNKKHAARSAAKSRSPPQEALQKH